ncbi:hypothetical protein Tco_1508325 [Tanacetum coccineum]
MGTILNCLGKVCFIYWVVVQCTEDQGVFDSLTLNQCNRFQAGKKKRKIPLSFCTPSLEAGSGTCLLNLYVERPEVPSTCPETGSPIRNVHKRLMAIESYMSIIVSGSSITNEHHVGATHIIRNPDMTDGGSMPIISNSDITDGTCMPISIIFNRFRNMGVNNTANTCGGSHEMLPVNAESGRVGRNVRRRLTTNESVMFGNVGRLPTAANASVLKPRKRTHTVQKTMAGSVNTLPTTDEQHPDATYIIGTLTWQTTVACLLSETLT